MAETEADGFSARMETSQMGITEAAEGGRGPTIYC